MRRIKAETNDPFVIICLFIYRI